MKALRKTSPAPGAEAADVEIPAIAGNEVLVKVKAAALCKSDVDVVEWTDLVRRGNFPLPVTLGHEFAGEVVEVGPAARRIRKGDRVCGETHNPCGVCHTCRTGNQHICRNGMGVLGRSMNGCFAEYIKIPEIMAVKLPDSVGFVQGAVMEPLATALHSLQKAGIRGESVAVLGVGAIGQMAVAMAKRLGAAKVFALGRSAEKLAWSKKLGADVIIDSRREDLAEVVMRHTGGVGVGAVLEMTGDQGLINRSVAALRVAGRLVQVGMVEKPLTFDNFMYGVAYKELVVTGIFGRRMYETWEELANVLEAGMVDPGEFVGRVIRFDEFFAGIRDFGKVNGRIVMDMEKK